MGNFASRIHSKEDGKIYNILPMGDMPTVVFGRVIKEHSVPGMQYYFSDGRVKYSVPKNISGNLGWNYTIPFTKPKEFSAIKFDSNDGDTWLYKRYRDGDRRKNGYAWAYCNTGDNKEITDSSVDWSDIDYTDILYTGDKNPIINSHDRGGEYEILDYNSAVTSTTINQTQLPVIFNVPENLDFSRMNDVEYVKQFCRTAVSLNANTMSNNFIIINGKIVCIKSVDFDKNKILSRSFTSKKHTTGTQYKNLGDRLDYKTYKSSFKYRYLKTTTNSRRARRGNNNYKMRLSSKINGCVHNEFTIIPTVKRNKNKEYLSINEYKAYRYGLCPGDNDHFGVWKWKLK